MLVRTVVAKDQIRARLQLEQRRFDPKTVDPYFGIMTSIATAIGVTLSTSIHNDVKYSMISASNSNSRTQIVSYFIMFPLFSSKHLNYLN